MNYQKTCNYCTSTFEAARSDAKYCTDKCRARASQQRQLEKDTLYKREMKYKALQNQIKKVKESIPEFEKNRAEHNQKVERLKKRIAKNKEVLTYPQARQKRIMLDYACKQKGWDKGTYEYDNVMASYANVELHEIQKDFREFNAEITELIKRQEKQLESIKLENFKYLLHPEFELERLEKELQNLIDNPTEIPILAKPLPKHKTFTDRKRTKSRRRTNSVSNNVNQEINANGMGGADIQNMKFDTFGLPDELGRFLGDLDRNKLAFALTGESGSGKSYFSYELARLFLDGGFKVKYYSLEEGIGKLTQEKLVIYDIGNEMQLTGEGGLKDIRKDAELFDAIIVDSFSKLTSDPKEFENLRSRFPKTIFVIIFQQTTAKTMKGGASIKYNSSATINLKIVDGERVAIMEKGRYGTQGWIYSIDQEKIITEF